MLFVILCIFAQFLIQKAKGACYSGENISYNKSIDGSVVASIPALGLHMCVRECLSWIAQCKSVNFDRRLLQCNLMKESEETHQGRMMSHALMLYTSSSLWMKVRTSFLSS